MGKTGKAAENRRQELPVRSRSQEIRFDCSTFRAVKGVDDGVDEIIPVPSSVDIRTYSHQQTLRGFSVGLVVVNSDAGGLDAIGNYFVPLVDQQSRLCC